MPDSVDQLGQIIAGRYSNHHPFYQTILIRPFVITGIKLWGDLGNGVAMYSLFQIVIMSAIFSFMISTLYEIGFPSNKLKILRIIYILMPYHFMYSFHIWKDTLFGGCILLFILAMYREIKTIGFASLNHFILTISGLGICLFRSNGLIVFIISTTVFFVLFGKKNKKTVFMLLMVAFVGFFAKHIVLDMLNVRQPDFIEALSIPIQQVSRVIYDGNELSDDEISMVKKLGEIEGFKINYDSHLSDPEKNFLRSNGANTILEENKIQYLKMYISIGLKHPWTYLKAWIDQTRGFWSAGYPFYVWDYVVYPNELGLRGTTFCRPLMSLVKLYCGLFYNVSLLQIFISIGFHVWLVMLLLFVAILRKDKVGIIITVPIFAVILTLMIATPLNNEFRYIYSLFCCLPFISAESLIYKYDVV